MGGMICYENGVKVVKMGERNKFHKGFGRNGGKRHEGVKSPYRSSK